MPEGADVGRFEDKLGAANARCATLRDTALGVKDALKANVVAVMMVGLDGIYVERPLHGWGVGLLKAVEVHI